MSKPIDASSIVKLQQDAIIRWKSGSVSLTMDGLYQLVEKNHHFNYQLWHAEDRARREDQGFEFVYRAKREIDGLNQQRNNYMELIDADLFQKLSPSLSGDCPVHSETPGMMIDRLSILALKHYHMALQAGRQDADEEHRNLCAAKLAVISQQQKQLAVCLDAFIAEALAQTRTFRVYQQFKMYNDPKLNPQLYQ